MPAGGLLFRGRPTTGFDRPRVVRPLLDRLPHRLRSCRVPRQLKRRSLQLSRREALLLQDRVTAGLATNRVKSWPVTHLLQGGHDGNKLRFTHAIQVARAPAGAKRGKDHYRERRDMCANVQRFHEAARLSDRFQCVKQA